MRQNIEMSITIKYFGAIAEQTGVTEETLDFHTIGSEVSQLKVYCIEKYGLIDDDTFQVAVNQELNKVGPIQDGDEIALLPPFAGG